MRIGGVLLFRELHREYLRLSCNGRADKNAAFLSDPRPAHKGERSLGWTSNTGNYFGADGSQGTVLNVNTTAGTRYRLSLYLVSGIQPNASTEAACPTVGMVSSPCSATKEAIRVMDLETLNPIAPEPLLEDAEPRKAAGV